MARKYEMSGPRPSFPVTIEGWREKQAAARKLPLHLHCLAPHNALIVEMNGTYTALYSGRNAAESIHGNIAFDKSEAARLIQAKAEEMGIDEIVNAKRSDVSAALSRMFLYNWPEMSRARLIRESRVLIGHVGGGDTAE